MGKTRFWELGAGSGLRRGGDVVVSSSPKVSVHCTGPNFTEDKRGARACPPGVPSLVRKGSEAGRGSQGRSGS